MKLKRILEVQEKLLEVKSEATKHNWVWACMKFVGHKCNY